MQVRQCATASFCSTSSCVLFKLHKDKMSADKTTTGPLKDLECLFTWDVKTDDITDLAGIPQRLLARIKSGPRRCHATYYNILAFVSHLHGKTNIAFENLAKAEAVLKEEKREEADFLVTYSSFAWLYHHLGSLEDVETYLSKVKSVSEGRDIALEAEKGWSFIRLGAEFYQRAKECFEKALEIKPDCVSYNAGYAIVLSWLKNNTIEDEEAMQENTIVTKQLQKALDLDPTDNEIMILLALQLQNSNPSQSRELIYKALTRCADIHEFNRYTCIYFRQEGPTEDSFKFLEEIKETFPNSYFPYEQMGRWHWRNMIKIKSDGLSDNSPQVKTAVREAIRFFKKAVDLEPSEVYIWVLLAEAYEKDKKVDRSEAIFTWLLSGNSLQNAERQMCHRKYGEFLMFHTPCVGKAVEQLKSAYRIKIKTHARDIAHKRLLQITTWDTRVKDDILAFLSSEDDQGRQPTTALNSRQMSW